jgi:hypothetical protein
MQELLIVLRDLIIEEFKDKVRSVLIADQVLATKLLNVGTPCIYIIPQSRSRELGPFSMTMRKKYVITIRCVAQSIDPAAIHVRPHSGTNVNFNSVDVLADTLEALLLRNKHVANNVFEMSDTFEAVYGTVSFNENTFFPAFDIQVGYNVLETYTGMQNDQVSPNLPPPQNYEFDL